jgi:hypothetical protein
MRPRRAWLLTLVLAWASPARAVDKAQCLQAYESAQRHKEASELTAAREDLLVCVDSTCPRELRVDCEAWLGQVQKSIPTVVFQVRSGGREVSDVQVSVDGEPLASELAGRAHFVDPGRRVFRFEAPGHAPLEQAFTIHEGEKNRSITIEIPADSSSGKGDTTHAPSTLSYVLAGVGAVGLLSFSYFGVKGLNGRSDLDACKGSCSQEDVDSVHADFTRADVSLAIAALALGGAAYLYFQGAPGKTEPRVGIVARPTQVSTAVRVAF